MDNPSVLQKRSPADPVRFADMIDKLVAVQMDLRAVCERPGEVAGDGRSGAIADACAVLQSAIDDLKLVIRELEDAGDAGTAALPP